MGTKDFTLDGVAPNLQLGLSGPRLKANGATLEARNAADAALAVLRAAPAAGATDVLVLSQLPSVGSQAAFGANALAATTATLSFVPAGSALLTIASLAPGFLIAKTGAVTSFAVRHTGDVLNILAQTVAYTLRRRSGSGVVTTLSTITLDASLASHGEASFGAVALSAGDTLEVGATPSAALTAVVTAILASAG